MSVKDWTRSFDDVTRLRECQAVCPGLQVSESQLSALRMAPLGPRDPMRGFGLLIGLAEANSQTIP